MRAMRFLRPTITKPAVWWRLSPFSGNTLAWIVQIPALRTDGQSDGSIFRRVTVFRRIIVGHKLARMPAASSRAPGTRE